MYLLIFFILNKIAHPDVPTMFYSKKRLMLNTIFSCDKLGDSFFEANAKL